jgi:hypothetical protein
MSEKRIMQSSPIDGSTYDAASPSRSSAHQRRIRLKVIEKREHMTSRVFHIDLDHRVIPEQRTSSAGVSDHQTLGDHGL